MPCSGRFSRTRASLNASIALAVKERIVGTAGAALVCVSNMREPRAVGALLVANGRMKVNPDAGLRWVVLTMFPDGAGFTRDCSSGDSWRMLTLRVLPPSRDRNRTRAARGSGARGRAHDRPVRP